MQKIYFIILFIMFCVSCDLQEAEEIQTEWDVLKEALPETSLVEKIEVEPLSLELLVGDFVREYSVMLTWREDPQFKEWFVKKKVFQEQTSKFIEVLKAENGSWIDKDIQEGQQIEYQLWGATVSGERKLVENKEIHIPTDMIIEGQEHIEEWEPLLNSGKPIGRLVFLEKASLQIEDKDFKIHVRELEAKEGKLLSFPFGQKASLGKEGRDGGSIEIYAEKAKGKLYLQLYGESGGEGQDGGAIRQAKKGAKGAKGSPAQYRSIESSFRCRGDICLDPPPILVCKKAPTYGEKGGQGGKGTHGTNGQKGGNSSPLHLEVKEGSEFQFSFATGPGKGGGGGLGGMGGEGGDGGAPGHSRHKGICSPARAGKKGPPGDQGDHGKEGDSGTSLPVCIRVDGIDRLGCYQ